MNKKNLTMSIDDESGIKHIIIKDAEIKKTISLSEKGTIFLDSIGADIILDFDNDNKLVAIELMGL